MTKKQRILLGVLLPITVLGGAGIGYGVYHLSTLKGNGGGGQTPSVVKESLNGVIANKDLGDLANYSDTTILQATENDNSGLDTSSVYVANITTDKATIVSKTDGKYAGNVNVTFSTPPIIETLTLTTDITSITQGATTTITGTLVASNFTLNTSNYGLIGNDATKFSNFASSGNTFEVKVVSSTDPGSYKLQVKDNSNDVISNVVTITVNAPVQTSFNVSCTNNTTGPNLVFNTADTLSLTWTSANYTPSTIQLKNDTSITDKWELNVLANHQLTLARKISNVPAGVYNVIIIGTDGTNTSEATVTVTISNPVEKDLFFTTGDTTTTPNSTKAFYGTISASNFTLCADTYLKVKVNGAISSAWTAKTFDNKTHIKITPPSSLNAGSKFQVAIYDLQNDITSNAIVFSVQAKMTVDNEYYVAIKNDGTVSKTAVAETLSLDSQNLVGLYFGQNSTVTTLECYSNQLQQLDVSSNSQLKTLDCYINQLTSLDVSNNSQLTSLYCESNQFQQLDVSSNSQLKTLDCSSNKLTQLDVSNNSQLTDLYCYSNQLQQLDVFDNSQLTTLDCNSNQLQQLDVFNISLLQVLDCSNNQLQQLDVSNNSELTSLYCNYNQLTSLDVSNNSQLTDLYCYSNPLNLIKLPTNKTSGSFTFTTSSTINDWTAYQYATTGDIYCNTSLTVYSLPSTWTRHNS